MINDNHHHHRPPDDEDDDFSMIEFFSGIGGMRLAVEGALTRVGSGYHEDDDVLGDDDDDNNNKEEESSSSSSSSRRIQGLQQEQPKGRQRRRKRRISRCHAYDISQYANQTYLYNHVPTQDNNGNNHGSTTVSTKLVEQLRDIPKADLWTLSPPCQPFTTTRGAKSLDVDDARCAGLKGIMRLLNGGTSSSISNSNSNHNHKPKWIFLENVQGFATSHMCEEWKQCLRQNGYGYQEYLLSPIQFGIPNHRLRYYMLCEYQSTRWTWTMMTPPIDYDDPGNNHSNDVDGDRGQHRQVVDDDKVDRIQRQPPPESLRFVSTRPPRVIGHYVDKCMIPSEQQPQSSPSTSILPSILSSFVIPDAILEKPWAKQLGVVGYGDTATHCFTAGYGRILSRSTGSVLLFRHGNHHHHHENEDETGEAASLPDTYAVEDCPLDRTNMLQYSGRLRRFTPHELLRLFGFPTSFGFPAGISLDHQYKLVGNSINVVVVTELMKVLLLTSLSSSRPATAPTAAGSISGQSESSSVPPTVDEGTLLIGGTKGHIPEYISGNLLRLYQAYRWKPLPNCTGRYTCREHSLVSTWSPLELLESAKISFLHLGENDHDCDGPSSTIPLEVYAFDLPGRSDRVLVVPLDRCNQTGVITFEKRYQQQQQQPNDEQIHEPAMARYVHTLNSQSGFRRKLNAIGIIGVTDDEIGIDK